MELPVLGCGSGIDRSKRRPDDFTEKMSVSG